MISLPHLYWYIQHGVSMLIFNRNKNTALLRMTNVRSDGEERMRVFRLKGKGLLFLYKVG